MPRHPPAATPFGRHFARLVTMSTKMTPLRAWAWSVAALSVVLSLDVVTGREVSLTFPSMLVTCFAAWVLRERGGLVIATVAALAASTIRYVEWSAVPAYSWSVTTMTLNVLSRLLSAGVTVMLVSGLRSTLELERWRASTDWLTGVLNKAAFEARMKGMIATARKSGCALVFAYMDLDGFKAVNDRHGHSAGDEVLRAFARTAAESIRGNDLFARIGGDEFVALLSVPDCDCGDRTAELLHARLSDILRESGYGTTCSMGALVIDAAHSDEEQQHFVALADQLMYEVKRSGKNALRIARQQIVGEALRRAYPPAPDDGLGALVAQVDAVDTADSRRAARRAA